MKTLKTMVLTTMVLTGIVTGLLVNEGIVKVEKVEEQHSQVVITDGEVTKNSSWTEVLGYKVTIDVVDSTYVGK